MKVNYKNMKTVKKFYTFLYLGSLILSFNFFVPEEIKKTNPGGSNQYQK